MNAKKLTKALIIFMAMVMVFAPMGVFAQEIFDDFLTLEEAAQEYPTYYITTSRLNLRSGPGTNHTRFLTVNVGRRVLVTGEVNDEWFSVVYNGTEGYMYRAHLRRPTPPLTPGEMPAIGEVEKLHWRDARNVMTIGTPATLIDVRTGLTWQVASFSNGNHADIEPLTAEDTAIKLEAFGGQWTWTPRPVIVLINGRTIAASVNGMPHGGATRSGNNMNGHICLHFYGSTTHRSAPQHVRDHQAAVLEAYNAALSWQ